MSRGRAATRSTRSAPSTTTPTSLRPRRGHTPDGGANPIVVMWDARDGHAAGDRRGVRARAAAYRSHDRPRDSMARPGQCTASRPDRHRKASDGAAGGDERRAASRVGARAQPRSRLAAPPSSTQPVRPAGRSRCARPHPSRRLPAEADVVTTATRARGAVPPLGGIVRTGTLVNAIGAITPERAEIAPDVVVRCDLVVADSAGTAERLATELNGRSPTPLHEIIAAGTPREPRELTMFKAMGIGLADLAIARVVARTLQGRRPRRETCPSAAGSAQAASDAQRLRSATMTDGAGKRFVDVSGKAPDDPEAWEPTLFTAAEIEDEIERLAALPQPADGRRESLFVHPRSTAPGLGLAPGIRVALCVLKPGEATRPRRQNSTVVGFCIRGNGAAIVGGDRIPVVRVRRVEPSVVPDRLARERGRRPARPARVLERPCAREAARPPGRPAAARGAVDPRGAATTSKQTAIPADEARTARSRSTTPARP